MWASIVNTYLVGPYFEDFELGEEMITEGRTIDRSDVVNFAGVSGDFAPMHMDAEFGKKIIFGENVAHGLCVMAVASGNIVRTGLLNNVMVFYGIKEWQFTKPLFFGDTIRVRIKVHEKIEHDKKDRGIVELFMEVINQKDEVLQRGIWRIMVRRKN